MKPLSLLIRILLASTKEGQWILDPLAGSCTTGIAARILGRKFFGIDQSSGYLDLGIRRFGEAETMAFQEEAHRRIEDLRKMPLAARETPFEYLAETPF